MHISPGEKNWMPTHRVVLGPLSTGGTCLKPSVHNHLKTESNWIPESRDLQLITESSAVLGLSPSLLL